MAERYGPTHSKVEVYFTDRDGVKWRVWEFGWVNHRAQSYPIGTIDGLYRGFVRVDDPSQKRAVMLAKQEHRENARRLSVRELQSELDRSRPWPRGII